MATHVPHGHPWPPMRKVGKIESVAIRRCAAHARCGAPIATTITDGPSSMARRYKSAGSGSGAHVEAVAVFGQPQVFQRDLQPQRIALRAVATCHRQPAPPRRRECRSRAARHRRILLRTACALAEVGDAQCDHNFPFRTHARHATVVTATIATVAFNTWLGSGISVRIGRTPIPRRE